MGTTLSGRVPKHHSTRDGQKFAMETTLVAVTCATCGILYAIPEGLNDAAHAWHGDRNNGWKLCCPIGHTWWYIGETEIETQRRRAREARDTLARERAAHDQTRSHLRGEKIAKSRFRNERDALKERAAAGVCPCCNRTFRQLARHMKSQHPGFAD